MRKHNKTFSRSQASTRIFRSAAVLILAVLLLSACSNGTVGIFYSVETVDIIDKDGRGLDSNATITSFAEDGTNDIYLLTIAALFYRDQTDGSSDAQWTTATTPDGYENAQKVAVTSADTTYVLFYHDDESTRTSALFTSTDPSAADPGWLEVSLPSYDDIRNFFITSDDTVFVELGTDGTYYLYDIAGNTVPNSSRGVYTDAVYDGTNYYFLTANEVNEHGASPAYTRSAANSLSVVDGESGYLKGLGYDGTTIYATSSDGYVFEGDGAGTWTPKGPLEYSDSSGESSLFDVTYVNGFDASFDGLYIGSASEGYITWDGTDPTYYYNINRNKDLTNFADTDVVNVDVIYADTDAGQEALFLLTRSTGLWRGIIEYSSTYGGDRIIWSQE